MKRTSRLHCRIFGILALSLAIIAPGAHAQLSGENLETPLPTGFKIGSEHAQGRFSQMEYIHGDETVDDWSVMITVTTIKGQLPQTSDQFSQGIADGYHSACARGEGHKLGEDKVNGYTYSQWMLTCNLNPATNKPEFLIMRSIQGQDAFFNVQYAFRAAPDDAHIRQAMDYLNTIDVCDTRVADRPCKVRTAPASGS